MDNELKILIAAISAGSAIAGAVIAQLVSILRDLLDKRHQRNVLLREKYEELAIHITDSQEWVSEQFSSKTLSTLRSSPPTRARKAMVLAHIYFPKLHEACENYVNSCAQFQVMLIENHEFTESYDAGTQAAHKNPDALEKSVSILHNCRQKLDEEIIKYAPFYAKA